MAKYLEYAEQRLSSFVNEDAHLVVVTGPLGIGKSTLLRAAFPAESYLDLNTIPGAEREAVLTDWFGRDGARAVDHVDAHLELVRSLLEHGNTPRLVLGSRSRLRVDACLVRLRPLTLPAAVELLEDQTFRADVPPAHLGNTDQRRRLAERLGRVPALICAAARELEIQPIERLEDLPLEALIDRELTLAASRAWSALDEPLRRAAIALHAWEGPLDLKVLRHICSIDSPFESVSATLRACRDASLLVEDFDGAGHLCPFMRLEAGAAASSTDRSLALSQAANAAGAMARELLPGFDGAEVRKVIATCRGLIPAFLQALEYEACDRHDFVAVARTLLTTFAASPRDADTARLFAATRARAESSGSAWSAALHHELSGWWAMWQGRHRAAREHLTEVEPLVTALPVWWQARAHDVSAAVHRLLGAHEAARRQNETHAELAEQLDDDVERCSAAMMAGLIELAEERPRAAVDLLERAWMLSRRAGARRREALVSAVLGDALAATGRHDEAIQRREHAIEVFESLGLAFMKSKILMSQAEHAAELGTLDEALLRRLRRCAAELDDPEMSNFIVLQEGVMAGARGDEGEARAKLRTARLASEQLGDHVLSRRAREHELEIDDAFTADLEVARDGSRFRTDGDFVDLSRRGALQRILKHLVHNLDNPAKAAELIDVGWGDEVVGVEHGLDRVYTAIRTLRRDGLDGVLITVDGGYLLKPGLRIEMLDAPAHTSGDD